MDPHGRPWTALTRTGNAVSGVTRIEGFESLSRRPTATALYGCVERPGQAGKVHSIPRSQRPCPRRTASHQGGFYSAAPEARRCSFSLRRRSYWVGGDSGEGARGTGLHSGARAVIRPV